jgi:site-specific recombinase XerD
VRGSIVKKGSRYYVVHDVYVDGQRKRRWTPAGTTQDEADDKYIEVMGQVKRGVYVDPKRTTVEQYLTGTWLPGARSTVKGSTAELYETIVAAYVKPHDLASIRLQQVRGGHLNALYAKLETSVRRNGKPLAAKTVRNVHTLLHRAFRDAVRWDLLVRNPADVADPPKVAGPTARYWTADQVSAFLSATAADRLGPLWVTIATTGVRRGEALALRWSDVHLDKSLASISRTLSWGRQCGDVHRT